MFSLSENVQNNGACRPCQASFQAGVPNHKTSSIVQPLQQLCHKISCTDADFIDHQQACKPEENQFIRVTQQRGMSEKGKGPINPDNSVLESSVDFPVCAGGGFGMKTQ